MWQRENINGSEESSSMKKKKKREEVKVAYAESEKKLSS